MNIAIVNDSLSDRTQLYNDVKKLSAENNILVSLTKYEGDKEFFENLSLIAMEIVFLVSYMKTFSIIEVAKKIHKLKPTCQIVFVTTSLDFAVKKNCVSYLNCMLNPYSERDLVLMLNKLDKNCQKSSRYINIRETDKWDKILLSDILYAEYYKHYVQIHTKSNILRCDLKFNEIMETLLPYKFFLQCNRFIIINMDKIRKVSDLFFLLSNGEYIPINKKQAVEIKSYYADYIFGVIEEDDMNVEW